MKDNQMDINLNDKVHNNESAVPSNKNGDELSNFFVRFFKILYLHKWIFIIILIMVIASILFYGLSQPKIYQSEYEVFYNETVKEFSTGSSESSVRSDFDKNYWMSAMQSDELLRMSLKSAGLSYSINSFKRMISIGMIDKRKEDRIPVYKVSITSPTREHIPIIIRSYVNSLNELLLTNQIKNSERLVAYLSDQINQNNLKLSQLDIQIVTGGIANSGEIIDFDKIRSSLDAFRKDLLNAQVNLASISSARKRTERELQNLDGTIVNESAFSEPLKVQLMNLEVDLARALTKNKEDHPSIKQIRNNIGQISSMIRDTLEQRLEIRSMVQNPLKSQLMSKLLEYKISEVSEETRVSSLQKVISELEQKTLPNSINEDQQQTLRNREMIYLTIKQLNDKLIESQSTSHGSLSRFVFIDDPSSIFLANKNLLYYLILALLLGLVVASMVVFVYDLLDDRIMLVEDYEQFYNYPLLGIVRHYKSTENTLLSTGSDYNYHSVSDIGNLVVNLRQTIKLKKLKTIVISSPDRKEGKSLVSLKLASAMAAKKQKVLLVDLDFFSPKLSTRLNPILPAGLSDYLVDDCSLDNIIQNTEVETLKFVSAGNADGQKDLFYNDAKLAEFVEWAQANFDIVFFDTPAAMYIPDIVEFFEQMDAIVVIARLRRTTRKLLNRIFSLVSVFKSKYIGVILNDLYTDSSDRYSYYSYSNYDDKTDTSADDSKNKKQYSRRKILIIFGSIAILVLLAIAYNFYFNVTPDIVIYNNIIKLFKF